MHSRLEILEQLLQVDPFPGWDPDVVYPCLADKVSRLEFSVHFPYGPESLIQTYHEWLRGHLRDAITQDMPIEIGTTDKIRWMVQRHFECLERNRLAESAAIRHVFHSTAIVHAPVHVFKLCDLMWQQAGDQSTDMNYYTKRGSLALIYVATLLYWHHHQASLQATMDFFNGRLGNLHTLVSEGKRIIPSPENILKNIRLLKTVFWD